MLFCNINLDDQHKQFLLNIEYAPNDYPKYQNKYAGIGECIN